MLSRTPLSQRQVSLLQGDVRSLLPHLDLSTLDGQRLFVTGGTGFFGLWLLTTLQVLREVGIACEVSVLSRDPQRFLAQCPQFQAQPWLRFVVGDVRTFQSPRVQYDLIIHGATETSLAAHADEAQMFDAISGGTRQVLRLAEQCTARRILMTSSGAVYGSQSPDIMHQPETAQAACDPLQAGSAYGEGKRVMEMLGAILQRRTGISAVTARCYAFCGPGLPLDGHYAIGNFIRDALHKDRITIHGDGSPVRSYLYGADLALWLLRLLAHGEGGTAYNVGSDEALSILSLAHKVRDILAPSKQVAVSQARAKEEGSRQRYVPSIRRANAIGCRVWTPLDHAIRQTKNFVSER